MAEGNERRFDQILIPVNQGSGVEPSPPWMSADVKDPALAWHLGLAQWAWLARHCDLNEPHLGLGAIG
jgi:hypothetical protein